MSPYALAAVDLLRDLEYEDDEIVEELMRDGTTEDEARAIVAAAGVPA